MKKLRPLPLALSLLVAACATAPAPQPQTAPGPAPATAPTTAPAPEPQAPAERTDVWERLRGSFALPDCAADPAIDQWARRYTRAPRRFEAQLSTILPRLAQAQASAERHGVPGEFALLPWVESHFTPVPPRGNRPAGMWQIVPGTARRMGLRVERDYDGRLDLAVSSDAVMELLGHYHDWFQDWRLADYAYNAGRFGIDRLLAREGAPPAEPAIPKLPVRQGTRMHLVKLLAISCVVREPDRFGVTLPALDEDHELVSVPIDRRLPLALAAKHAGMPLADLSRLNAGYRNGVVDGRKAEHSLLLPREHAERLRAALGRAAPNEAASVAGAVAPFPSAGGTGPSATDAQTASMHVVRAGETLSAIARRYGVRVSELKRWNGLSSDAIRVGQQLSVSESE